jgi:hypothetical protein
MCNFTLHVEMFLLSIQIDFDLWMFKVLIFLMNADLEINTKIHFMAVNQVLSW